MENTVTTILIEVEDMPIELKDLFIDLIDRFMLASNMNFGKNVKTETVEKILADTQAFAEAQDGRQG